MATQVKGVVNITQYDEDELKVSVRLQGRVVA